MLAEPHAAEQRLALALEAAGSERLELELPDGDAVGLDGDVAEVEEVDAGGEGADHLRHVVVGAGAVGADAEGEAVIINSTQNIKRATKVLQQKALANPKLEFILNSVVTSVLGSDHVEAVKVKNLKSDEEKALALDGVFV